MILSQFWANSFSPDPMRPPLPLIRLIHTQNTKQISIDFHFDVSHNRKKNEKSKRRKEKKSFFSFFSAVVWNIGKGQPQHHTDHTAQNNRWRKTLKNEKRHTKKIFFLLLILLLLFVCSWESSHTAEQWERECGWWCRGVRKRGKTARGDRLAVCCQCSGTSAAFPIRFTLEFWLLDHI